MSRVVVAMSGGVDSSVAAAILKSEGHEVIGITLRLWAPSAWNDGEKFGSCCSPKDIADAKEVCRTLEIPHYTYNLEQKFKETVVDNFVSEYAEGRTPNPCVRCNAFVKFDVLLKYAVALNADSLATGHYARIEKSGDEYQLKKAVDWNKDQSYFLYMLGQKELSRVLFPLGGLTKTQVREAAANFGLPNCKKEDSQDVCFLEGGTVKDFLKERLGEVKKGLIMTREGKVLGTHEGLPYYTVGQREGLGIATGERTYVLEKGMDSNTLVVGSAEESLSDSCRLDSVSWCSDAPVTEREASVKIRYRHPGVASKIKMVTNTQAQVSFQVPQGAVSKGQSAVFYDGESVLGGGIIS